MEREKVSVLGYPFNNFSNYEELIQCIMSEHDRYKKSDVPVLTTLNVDQFVRLQRTEKELNNFVKKSVFIVPDGQAIVWASKMLGVPLKNRITGSDFFPYLWRHILKDNKNVFCLVSTDEIAHRLQIENPKVIFDVPDFFDKTDQKKIDEIAQIIASQHISSKLDYVILGLGFPKQELIYKRTLELLEGYDKPLFMPLGASFEFYLNLKKRAPIFWQKIGLEWFYRMMSEPKRMIRRYAYSNTWFFYYLISSLFSKFKI